MAEIILVADDDVDIARYVELNLTLEGFAVHVVHDGDAALTRALQLGPDAVLLDVMMPGLDGIEVCKQLRANLRTAHTAVIMLTAKALPADTIVGLAAGADDYIAKPFDPPELVARVQSAMRRVRQLRDISPLTGLPGNSEIGRQADRLVAQEPQQFALVHVDLDRFKAYNDRYGFVRGDEAIRATAELLSRLVARTEAAVSFLGHVGGDDFIILTSPGYAERLCKEVVADFDRLAPSFYDPDDAARGYIEIDDRSGDQQRVGLMTISLGVATSEHRHFATVSEASAVATEMKLAAKRDDQSSYRIDQRRA